MGLHYSAGAGQSLFSHRLLRTMWKSSRYILDAFAGEYDGRLLLESNGPNEAGIFRRLDKLRDRCFPDDPASGAHRAYEAVDKEKDRSGCLLCLSVLALVAAIIKTYAMKALSQVSDYTCRSRPARIQPCFYADSSKR